MEKLIIEIKYKGSQYSEYKVFNKSSITIGRDIQNDIALTDPYVSNNHLIIENKQHYCKIQDLGNENGIIFKNKLYLNNSFTAKHGETFSFGKTTIKIISQNHSLTKTKILQKTPLFLKKISHPMTAIIIFLLTCLTISGNTFLSSFNINTIQNSLIASFIAFIIIFSWTAIWSFISYIIKRRANFLTILSMNSLMLELLIILDIISSYLIYISNPQSPLATQIEYILILLVITFTFYFSISIATNMKKHNKIIFTLIPMIAISAIIFISNNKTEVELKPDYNYTLYPPILNIKKGKEIDTLLEISSKALEEKLKK